MSSLIFDRKQDTEKKRHFSEEIDRKSYAVKMKLLDFVNFPLLKYRCKKPMTKQHSEFVDISIIFYTTDVTI